VDLALSGTGCRWRRCRGRVKRSDRADLGAVFLPGEHELVVGPYQARADHTHSEHRAGFIVLGPLIAITLLVIIFVVAGKLMYAPAPVYIVEDRPVRRVATTGAPVFREARLVARVEPGDSLWVVQTASGAVVVYSDSTASVVVGVSNVLVESPREGALHKAPEAVSRRAAPS
jgi:hypothetical protein